jgi:uncharacterized membrane protein
MDTRKRSIAKSITFRLITIVVILICLRLYYDEPMGVRSMGYALLITVVQIINYYIHERVWDSIRWGRSKQKQSKKKTER